MNLIKNSKKLVIAVGDGFISDGFFEILLSADLIFTTEQTLLGFKGINAYVMPLFGGATLLSKITIDQFARYLLFTGEMIKATDLYEKGLIGFVCENRQELEAKVNNFVSEVTEKSIYAIGLLKEVIFAASVADLRSALLIEQNAFSVAFTSEDKREGMDAFLNRRKPSFKTRWEDLEDSL